MDTHSTRSVKHFLFIAAVLCHAVWVVTLPGQLAAQDTGAPDVRPSVIPPIETLDTPQSISPAVEVQASETAALADILSRLESLESDRSATATAQQADIEFLESPSVESLRVVNGRLHVDTWAFPVSSPGINLIENNNVGDAPDNRIELRRVRFSVSGKVPPENVSYHLDLEFSGEDRGQIRDAWIGYDDLPLLQSFRIGNQKRPYGLDELNSSNLTVFLERPLMIHAVNEINRRFGLMSYGTSDDRTLNWRFGMFHLEPFQGSGSITDDLTQLELSGRLAATSLYCENEQTSTYLHTGLSLSVGFPDGEPTSSTARFRARPEARSSSRWLNTEQIIGARAFEILGLECVFNHGPFQIGGETMHLWVQRETASGSNVDFHGGYVYASWFLTGEFLPWDRDLGILGRVDPRVDFVRSRSCRPQGLGAWQLATRFSVANFNDGDIFGGLGKSMTTAVNWYWNSHTRLQFNYIFGRVEDREVAPLSGPSQIVSGSYQILGTRLMIDF